MNTLLDKISKIFRLYQIIYFIAAVVTPVYGFLGLLSFIFVDKPINISAFGESLNHFAYMALLGGKFIIWFKLCRMFTGSLNIHLILKVSSNLSRIGKLLIYSFALDSVMAILAYGVELGPAINWDSVNMPDGFSFSISYILGLVPFLLKWSMALSKFLVITINGLPALLIGCIFHSAATKNINGVSDIS